MPFKEIKRISRTADCTEPPLPAIPAYLRPLIEEALSVWVMGALREKPLVLWQRTSRPFGIKYHSLRIHAA